VPVIARLHGSLTYFASELNRPAERLPERLERAGLRRVDFVASVCKYTARRTEEVLGVPMSSAQVLYNPVEFSGQPQGLAARHRHRVVFSGTLTPKKGIVSLIKAWPAVVRSVPDAELHVFGKDGRAPSGGSMQEFLGAMLNGERPSVHFHGHVGREKLFEAYRTAGAAVFPSYAEAFAVAPLESMAVGCPTIATKRGSGPELLDHESEGLLVDPDNPAEIAGSIVRVMRDESFAAKIGENGSARVRSTFTVDRLAAENEEFYQRCIREFAARKN
jgi:glycosyltransferase involved in cell wall biosynthesis